MSTYLTIISYLGNRVLLYMFEDVITLSVVQLSFRFLFLFNISKIIVLSLPSVLKSLATSFHNFSLKFAFHIFFNIKQILNKCIYKTIYICYSLRVKVIIPNSTENFEIFNSISKIKSYFQLTVTDSIRYV